VAIGLPAANRAGQLDGPRVQQEFFSQRGLACVWVGNDGEGSTALNFALERRGRDYGFDLT
jgi:hypothetical protein